MRLRQPAPAAPLRSCERRVPSRPVPPGERLGGGGAGGSRWAGRCLAAPPAGGAGPVGSGAVRAGPAGACGAAGCRGDRPAARRASGWPAAARAAQDIRGGFRDIFFFYFIVII